MIELITITITMKVEGDRAKVEEGLEKMRTEMGGHIGEESPDEIGILRGFSAVAT